MGPQMERRTVIGCVARVTVVLYEPGFYIVLL